MSAEQTLIAHVDHMRPAPVVELPEHLPDPLPEIALYPLPNQVADKLCALYEQHASGPSTRYRDLVDLVLITTLLDLDPHLTRTALEQEAQRRNLRLPAELVSPGPGWEAGYRRTAHGTNLPTDLHELPAALAAAGTRLNPLLRDLDTGDPQG